MSSYMFLAEFWSLSSSYGTELHFQNLEDISVVFRMGVPCVLCATGHPPYTCQKVPMSSLPCCPFKTKNQLNNN